jgi:rubrerythrin
MSQLPQRLLNILGGMRELEVALSQLYGKCAEAWPEGKNLWQELSRDEKLHAQYVEKMVELVKSSPGAFELNPSFKSAASAAFLKYVASVLGKVDSQGVTHDAMLLIARDIEQALLDAKYSGLVKTRSAEYRALLTQLIKDTEGHRDSLAQKIRALQGGSR